MSSNNKIKIFLASSGELAEERKEIELFIGKENKKYFDETLCLDLVIWEGLNLSFSGDRIQDQFNEKMLTCEIVIVLIFTKVGEFTKEEFDKAYGAFKSAKNPRYLYVYFKDANIKISEVTKEYMDVIELKEEIQRIEQIYCHFDSIDNLILQLNKQLNLIIPELKKNETTIEEHTELSTPTFSKLEEINNHIYNSSKKDKYYDEKNNISKIENILKENNTLSIVSCTGMGGVGKSTLAIEYAYSALEKGVYNYVIWLSIEGGLEVAVKQFVIRYLIANDDGKQEMVFYINSFVTFINQEYKVLMIFDNYSSSSLSKDELHAFLQRVKSQDALLTSREKTKLENQKIIEVDVFENVDDGLEMFEKCSNRIYSNDEKDVLKEIVERLGLLPLAIEITAIYLSEYKDMNVKKYFNELKKECVTTLENINEEDMPKIHKDNIRATLKIASKVQENPEMLLYLKLFSLLSAEPISDEIFRSIVTKVQDDVSEIRFIQTIGDLNKFYYIRQENSSYVMHRLLQEVIAEEYLKDLDKKRELLTATSLALFWWMKKAFEDSQYGAYFDQQMAHVKHLLKVSENITESNEIKSYLLTCKSAYINTKTVEVNAVYLYAKEAVDLLEVSSVNGETEAVIREQYAHALELKGEYNLALEEYNKALNININTLGEKHQDTAATYNNIGSIYDSQGKHNLALKEFNRALNIHIATLGENHPSTASSYNYIGLVYDRQGKYNLALKEFNRALNIQIATLGENHPSTAGTYYNIGSIYNSKGEYDLALKEHKRALNIEIATLGENNPNTATSYNNIGTVYNNKGEYDLALKEHKRALNIQIATLGENHPNTATSYNDISIVYHNLGEYDLALKEYNRALNIYIATVGKNHPHTATTYNNIASIYNAQNMFYKAYKSMAKSIEIRLKVEKNDLTKMKIRNSFASLNDFMSKAQLNTNKDQKVLMQKKIKEMKIEAKRLKIKL
jgi:tetratricopeptide (TPR) repeat protein